MPFSTDRRLTADAMSADGVGPASDIAPPRADFDPGTITDPQQIPAGLIRSDHSKAPVRESVKASEYFDSVSRMLRSLV
jgi:hypothetical protein